MYFICCLRYLKDDLVKIVNEFNKIPDVEKDYLLRENKPLNEIKRFNRLFHKLKREISFRFNDISCIDNLLETYKSLKFEHLFRMNVHRCGNDLQTLILKAIL